MKKDPLVKPFLKWAGGKRQLLPEILKHLPPQSTFQQCTYYEPFLGGGALFFEIQPQNAVINDSNFELVNCYQVVKNSVYELIESLRIYQKNHTETYYYQVRELDRCREQYAALSTIEKAARLIYLNKTCYNGLFRVNSQGQFNVPIGKYKNPNILDEAVLKAVSAYLNSAQVNFSNTDFEIAVKDAQKGDFIYFDPPYDPVSDTASFTSYDIYGFNQDEQKRLRKVFEQLNARGCQVMLSNSCTDFILNLYQDYQDYLKKISATRSINSNALKRGVINEILVLNYDPKALN